MTPKQKEQFNRMRNALKRIASHYESVEDIERHAEKKWGLPPEEAIRYAYDNVQDEARSAVRGVQEIKP